MYKNNKKAKIDIFDYTPFDFFRIYPGQNFYLPELFNNIF
jgi:hypothetical protein